MQGKNEFNTRLYIRGTENMHKLSLRRVALTGDLSR